MNAARKIHVPEVPGELDAFHAVEFLKSFDPNGWHNLVAIELTSRDPIGRTFKPGDWMGIEKFIERHNGKANLYFSVNEPKPGSGHKKLKRGDIAAARAVKVDLDPGKGEDLVDYRKASLEKIRGAAEPPTFIIDSGGGVQAFWKLQEKLPIEDGKWLYGLNEAACNALSGDVAVKNIDRIMRLPHTLNLPTPSKLKKHPNRQPRMATVISSDGPVIDRQKLEAAFPPVVREKKREVVAGPQPDLALIESALTAIPNNDMDYGPWIRLLHTVWAAVGDQKAEGFELFETWSARSDKHDLEDMAFWWDSINEVRELTVRTLFYEARKHGWAEDMAHHFQVVDGIDLLPEAANDNAAAKKTKFFSLTFADAIDTALESFEPLIEGVADLGAAINLVGDSNTGKTFVAFSVAAAIAQGQSWAGREVAQGPVLYIAAESGLSSRKRMKALNMRGVPREAPLFLSPNAVDIFSPTGDTASIVAEAKKIEKAGGRPVVLIVIDTLARSMGAGEENSATDMAAVIRNIDRIREQTTAAVMLVHHTGKDAARGARGSSALRAAMDTELTLSRSARSPGTIKCTKQRDGEYFDDIVFDLQVVDIGSDRKGNPVTSCVIIFPDDVDLLERVTPAAEKFLAVLASIGGTAAWSDWCDAYCKSRGAKPGKALPSGCSSSNLRNLKKEALDADRIVPVAGSEEAYKLVV